MGKINVLDFEVANLIAAGEVVERPSSVLKELIENSIDSGATRIIAEIKRGGVSLIRVSDNGCGMSADDLPVAIKRHATSKIRTKEDLDAIGTLGFRGEALAAISAVSKVTIITKTAAAESASMLSSEGGAVVDISEVGAADGTTVVVEDLFFNVPARRKFLKKDATEAMNVTALVEKVARSRPDIAIQLLIDGNEKFATPGDGDLYNTVYAVFGKDFASKLIKAEGKANGVKVSGYIGRSDNIKKNRNYENVFINGRYVKSLTVQAAVEKAYTSYLAPEGFPVCVLFLEMNPTMVDVNVHPAKLEVKFAGEQPVFEAVYHTVRAALEDHEYRPELTLGARAEKNPLHTFVPIGADTKGKQISIDGGLGSHSNYQRDGLGAGLRSNELGLGGGENPGGIESSRGIENLGGGERSRVDVSAQSPYNKYGNGGFPYGKDSEKSTYRDVSHSSGLSDRNSPSSLGAAYNSSYRVSSGAGERFIDDSPRSNRFSESVGRAEMSPKESVELLGKYAEAKPLFDIKPSDSKEKAEQNASSDDVYVPHKTLGEAFNCYIFVEYDGELLVIDKHAAHERILFEELLSQSRLGSGVSSQSLLLPITVLLSPEEMSEADEYRDELLSVGYDFEVGDGFANLLAIPDAVSAADSESLFVEMLDELVEGRGNPALNDSLRRERALYQIACKAAVKGGRVYDESVREWIVNKVLSLPDVTVCPHGRPIAFKLTKSELDRRFERLK